jgi:hypothetical protein
MKAHGIALMFGVALIAAPLLSGCDRSSEEKTTVHTNSDGTQTTDSQKETVSADGHTVTKSDQQTVNPPPNRTESDTTDSTKVTVAPDGQVTKTEEHSTTPGQ